MYIVNHNKKHSLIIYCVTDIFIKCFNKITNFNLCHVGINQNLLTCLLVATCRLSCRSHGMPYGGIPAEGVPSAGKLAEVVLSAGVPAECMTVHAVRSNQKMVYCSWKRKLY